MDMREVKKQREREVSNWEMGKKLTFWGSMMDKGV